MSEKKSSYKKIALALSLCLLITWGLLGTSASIAWFRDTSNRVSNVFNTADFNIDVSYRTADGSYKSIDSSTNIFDDKALYEPGYVQVVYFKVQNKGDLAFDYKTAVNVLNYTEAVNVFGTRFNLRDYLRFGMATAATEEELEAELADRESAKKKATMALDNYVAESSSLDAGATEYMALIVRMPEEVQNDANYRGNNIPKVELGITVSATQKN